MDGFVLFVARRFPVELKSARDLAEDVESRAGGRIRRLIWVAVDVNAGQMIALFPLQLWSFPVYSCFIPD